MNPEDENTDYNYAIHRSTCSSFDETCYGQVEFHLIGKSPVARALCELHAERRRALFNTE